ncbi:MAG: hypothetical protein E6Q97_12185 [Desulfurellales bacterium]|nr:MAG: hypothetical protein E6Q97_12185 [Desulfurellales bacterium]
MIPNHSEEFPVDFMEPFGTKGMELVLDKAYHSVMKGKREDLASLFWWHLTREGYVFWHDVCEGRIELSQEINDNITLKYVTWRMFGRSDE